jgi:hypothetical protein
MAPVCRLRQRDHTTGFPRPSGREVRLEFG